KMRSKTNTNGYSRSEPAFGTLSFANRRLGMVKSQSLKRWLKRNGSVTTLISSWPGLPIGLDLAEHELESASGQKQTSFDAAAMSVSGPIADLEPEFSVALPRAPQRIEPKRPAIQRVK